uniref:Uncharacterized protein n=1 Tax=Avena sativa TaxID=4498 RepID=A0ACD5V4Z0_AVESA
MRRYTEMVQGSRCIAMFVLVCMAARGASAITDGLLPNGNFEQAPSKSEMNGTRVTGRYAIPCWEIAGSVEYIVSGQNQGDMVLPVPEGAYAVRLGNGASVQQQLSVTPGTHYSVTFSAARTCAQAAKLDVTVAPDSDELPIQTVYTSSGWDSYSWAFQAKDGVVSLVVRNPGVTDEDAACGPLLDAFAVRTLLPPQRNADNMLANGDFEEGPYIFPNTAWGVLVPPMDEDGYSPLHPWMILSTTKSVKYVDAAHYAVPRGARAVELVSGAESALVQEVGTVPGRAYRMEFSVGDGADGCAGSLAVEAYAASGRVKVPYESSGTGGYKRGVLDFTAAEERTRVVFVSVYYNMKPDGTLCGPVVDDASLVSAESHARRLL